MDKFEEIKSTYAIDDDKAIGWLLELVEELKSEIQWRDERLDSIGELIRDYSRRT